MAAKKTAPKKTASEKSELFSPMPLSNRLNRKTIRILITVIACTGLLYYFKGFFVPVVVNGTPIDRISLWKELEKQNGQQVLKSLVVETLLHQEATKRNITVSEQEIDQEIKKIEENLKKQGQSLESVLAIQQFSLKELRRQIRTQKTVEELLADKTKVASEEVKKYVEENKDTLPESTDSAQRESMIRDQLRQQKLSEELQKLIESLQKSASITYL